MNRYFGFSGVLFWVGLALLLLLAVAHLVRRREGLAASLRAPLVCIVLLTLLGEAAYAATDFQSYPDAYPFLPYPALGIGGAVAALLGLLRSSAARTAATAVVLAASVVLTALSWSWFTNDRANDHGFGAQRSAACAVQRVQVPGTPIWSLGDPSVLVATHRRNPDRFVYLSSGVDRWKLEHTPGGFAGWTRQIQQARPSVVVIKGWAGPVRQRMGTWLRANGFHPGYVATWRVFLSPAARARAATHGVLPTPHPTHLARGAGGRQQSANTCE